MTSEPYRSLLKETWRNVMNISHFQISLSTIHRKMKKKSYKSRNLENQFQHGMIDLIDYNLYQIFKIILNIFKKNMKHLLIILRVKYIKIKSKKDLHTKLRIDIA